MDNLFLCDNIAGLYKAAHDHGVEWVVVKGISNLADGDETAIKDWKVFSSLMAASLVKHMFKYSVVIENWPHYKSSEDMTGKQQLSANRSIDDMTRQSPETSNNENMTRQQMQLTQESNIDGTAQHSLRTNGIEDMTRQQQLPQYINIDHMARQSSRTNNTEDVIRREGIDVLNM